MNKIELKIKFLGLICQIAFLGSELVAHGHHHHDSDDHKDEEFQWTKEKTEFGNILMQVAGPGLIQNYIQVAGKITLHPDHLAYVIPKVNGTIWDVRKNLGDSVEKDEVLALIESKEIAEAKTNYLVAQKKLTLYEVLLQKEELTKGISPLQDYLSATLAAEEAFIHLQFATQHLYALGLTDEEITKISQDNPHALRFYAVKSPLKGKILERSLTLGELSNSDTKIFTIANFDKIWVEMHIPQRDVRFLAEGLPVEILAGSEKQAHVHICQFNPAINEETRTATAIALLENISNQWTPGEFITARIQTDTVRAPIVVPREAIQNIKGEMVIFVENASNFVPCVVKLGKMDQQNVEIVSGLKEGATYAACNTFCMKADYQKEEAEHSH